jgi:hypothetical protein
VTFDEVSKIAALQNWSCAICSFVFQEKSPNFVPGPLVNIDHDHSSGKLRGILCKRCNCALGMLRDNPQSINSLRGYCIARKDHDIRSKLVAVDCHGETKRKTAFVRRYVIVNGQKQCGGCELSLPIESFWRDRRTSSGLNALCKKCDRNRKIKKEYKMNPADVTDQIAAQNGKCAACGMTRNLVIDHSHSTGKVRGLLCRGCNLALGFVGEDPKILASMLVYIEKWNAFQAKAVAP